MSAILDKLNDDALKFNEAIADTVKEISQPLSDFFGISHFGHTKIKEDGTLLRLSTNKTLTKTYFKKKYYNDSNVYCFTHIPVNSFQVKIHAHQPIGDVASELYESDVWNIYSVHQRFENHAELTFFASTRENTRIIDFYLNHQDILKNFIRHFKGEMKSVIETSSPDVWIKTDLKIQEIQLQEDRNLNKFLSQINKNHKSDLTPRELECVKHLITGKTIKEIASILQLSPRTVEFYLKNVKAKTGCKRTHQLMSFFLKRICT